jgi:hypothetical protein
VAAGHSGLMEVVCRLVKLGLLLIHLKTLGGPEEAVNRCGVCLHEMRAAVNVASPPAEGAPVEVQAV